MLPERIRLFCFRWIWVLTLWSKVALSGLMKRIPNISGVDNGLFISVIIYTRTISALNSSLRDLSNSVIPLLNTGNSFLIGNEWRGADVKELLCNPGVFGLVAFPHHRTNMSVRGVLLAKGIIWHFQKDWRVGTNRSPISDLPQNVIWGSSANNFGRYRLVQSPQIKPILPG